MSDKEQRWLASLTKVTAVLRKNNIDYFLDMGTLLGAAREKKFIPWDNDIDLGIIYCKHTETQFHAFINDIYNCRYNVNYSYSGIGIRKSPDIEVNLTFYRDKGDAYISQYTKYKCRHPILIFLRNVKKGTHIISRGYGIKFNFKHFIFSNKYLLNFVSASVLDKFVTEVTKNVVVSKHYLSEIAEICFYGLSFPAPKYYNAYLEYRYGSNWITPLKDYNYFTDDHALDAEYLRKKS